MFQTLRNREAAMPFIMLAVLIDMAAIGVIVPVSPAPAASSSANQADQA
jgi:DHA1 family tetracycline resistance protein-like MFS transporter